MSQSATRIEDPFHFLDLAFGYYMTGRFAVINGLFVAPNLMHHAAELLIKYSLLKDVPQDQHSDATAELARKYGHRLTALWNRYKQHVAPSNMSRFDTVITDLARWEKVRYGGFPAGIQVGRGMGLVRAPVQTSAKRDTYIFGLDEVDDLIAAILAASAINPGFVGSSYSHTELPEWYKRHNAHIMKDLFR